MNYAATSRAYDEVPSVLHHHLGPHLSALARFESTSALEASSLYRDLQPHIEKVLGGVVQESFAVPVKQNSATATHDKPHSIRATAWNIERGARLASITRVLKEHPVLCASDLLLLTELDYGMARTNNCFVAREIARALRLNYVFAPCYLALNKGSGVEVNVTGVNEYALHGNALFSRYPLDGAHSLALPNGKDKMSGKEKRIGCQRAVIADVDHPSGTLRVVSLHLDAHSTQRHRHHQMQILLDHLQRLRPALPTLIGGDWNTSTYNSKHALYAILGYWRRVLMGVGNVIRNHYPYPERWFERKLFRELEQRGFSYRDLNELGACTLHYDTTNIAVNRNMADWIPQWCFAFINWSLAKHGGRCSLKLDWFAGKAIAADPVNRPRVISGLHDRSGQLSDHDAIVLDFVLAPLE